MQKVLGQNVLRKNSPRDKVVYKHIITDAIPE
jgi:hypothetical protein